MASAVRTRTIRLACHGACVHDVPLADGIATAPPVQLGFRRFHPRDSEESVDCAASFACSCHWPHRRSAPIAIVNLLSAHANDAGCAMDSHLAANGNLHLPVNASVSSNANELATACEMVTKHFHVQSADSRCCCYESVHDHDFAFALAVACSTSAGDSLEAFVELQHSQDFHENESIAVTRVVEHAVDDYDSVGANIVMRLANHPRSVRVAQMVMRPVAASVAAQAGSACVRCCDLGC